MMVNTRRRGQKEKTWGMSIIVDVAKFLENISTDAARSALGLDGLAPSELSIVDIAIQQ